ncbi:MAG: NDP-hexose 2,3-dehydratase [Pedobacter sp.]|nr:MAG: NDP-hexose 2,3-dehydratase [Pedobacter sp.]
MNDLVFQNSLKFLKSALTKEGEFTDTAGTIQWIREQNEKVHVEITRVPFKDLKLWSLGSDALRHDTGKFFSIDGIKVQTNWGSVNEWTQPIINQPEIGYLGFITKEFNGILYFLMQAKIEPGNVNFVQLSPTLQATKSNYTGAHKGKSPAYLSYFQNATKESILLDQLQSEQGGRFLKKRNRNIIIQIDDEIEVLENFVWLTLGQIKTLMKGDNLVNMDTRTVISGIPYGDYSAESIRLMNFLDDPLEYNSTAKRLLESYLNKSNHINSFNDVLSFITDLKCKYDLKVTTIPLTELDQWEINDSQIQHVDGKYFRIIAAQVEISNREVVKWSQPMVEPAQEGICAFICKEINGILHFIVQAKLECGNFDIIELAPTVQCLTGHFNNERSINKLPFLNYVLENEHKNLIYDVLQSEEGGRFYREQNRNMIILADEEISNELPENYIWMTLNQLQKFIQYNNYINIQARSLMAAISFN